MANRAVRAGPNQLVIFFKRHRAAPIRSKVIASPERDTHTRGGDGHAQPGYRERVWNEAGAEPAVAGLGPKCQAEANEQRQNVGDALEPGFALLGFFASDGG